MAIETWVLGIILTAVEVAITTVLGLWINHVWKKKHAEQDELAQLREEKRAAGEQKRCELVKTAIHEEVIQLEKDLTEKSNQRYNDLKQDIIVVHDDLELVKKGLQNDLYIDLVHLHDVYMTQGYVSRSDKRDYDTLYWNYHNLGKNGIADGMHDEVMALPEAPKGE